MTDVQIGTPTPTPAPAPTPAPTPTPDPNASGISTPPGNLAPRKLAGKYDTDEALYDGIRNARKALGLPDIAAEKKIVGKDGIYTDVNAAEAAYTDLAALISKKPPTPPPASTLPPDDETTEQALERAGLKGQEQALADQWRQDGKLTDDQYAKLKAIGYSKASINAQMEAAQLKWEAGQRANSDIRSKLETVAGGKDQLDAALITARSMPAARIADLNGRLKHPDLAEAAARELLAFHHEKNGTAPPGSMITGGGAGGAPTGAPQTIDEFTRLVNLSIKGDKNASAILMRMTPADKQRLGAAAFA